MYLIPFWVYWALGDMLNSIVSNSHFGKRPTAWVMTIFGYHVGAHVSESVSSYSWNFAISGTRPSPELIFCFLLLPCGWEIGIWVYHLRRGTVWEFVGFQMFSGYSLALSSHSSLSLLSFSPLFSPALSPYWSALCTIGYVLRFFCNVGWLGT